MHKHKGSSAKEICRIRRETEKMGDDQQTNAHFPHTADPDEINAELLFFAIVNGGICIAGLTAIFCLYNLFQ